MDVHWGSPGAVPVPPLGLGSCRTPSDESPPWPRWLLHSAQHPELSRRPPACPFPLLAFGTHSGV